MCNLFILHLFWLQMQTLFCTHQCPPKPWAFGDIANNTDSYFMALHNLASDILVPKCQPALTVATGKSKAIECPSALDPWHFEWLSSSSSNTLLSDSEKSNPLANISKLIFLVTWIRGASIKRKDVSDYPRPIEWESGACISHFPAPRPSSLFTEHNVAVIA